MNLWRGDSIPVRRLDGKRILLRERDSLKPSHTITAGKITAGTLTADIIIHGTIRTALIGRREETSS